jgi:ABC-2 type transport system ATP-binding protein
MARADILRVAVTATTKVGGDRPVWPPSDRGGLTARPMCRTVSLRQPAVMITTTSLTKRYGRVTAVDGVTFSCAPGTITGFLGGNGAGKSTTLRMITGLTRPDSGRATIGGKPFARLANPARTVGTLLDAAAFHDGRTGRATLRTACTIAGVPHSRAEELLAVVGLARDAGRRTGGYSLGMRQRLGLAHALIGEPSVLILDEPANGLDPAGVAWIRELLRDFAGRGGTVLLSSHLLAEVQATADHLVIIDRGRVIASGTQRSLLARSGQTLEELFLSLTAANGTAA